MITLNLPQTVAELTDGLYNELSYNSATTIIKGVFVTNLCGLLRACGIKVANTTEYNLEVSNAVMEFQALLNMEKKTGILDDATYQTMILYYNKLIDNVIEEDDEDEEDTKTVSISPHFDSFFADERFKMFRRNHKDIKIVFGNGSVTKTIKDVFMRSVTVEVDTSGNPISEVYEFIARDIKESDELSDASKYVGSGEFTTSSDVKYLFNY